MTEIEYDSSNSVFVRYVAYIGRLKVSVYDELVVQSVNALE